MSDGKLIIESTTNHFRIEVWDGEPPKEAMDNFNAACAKYEKDAWDLATRDLTPEEVAEVQQWQKGRSLPANFWTTVSKPAYNAISILISYGLG